MKKPKFAGIENMKKSITIQDTWAIWHPDDKQEQNIKTSDEKLKDWYGIDSPVWNELFNKTTKKPEIIFVGENPSKNNKKILKEDKLIIQCFHSNSSQDLLLKKILENGFFKGTYMTDAFDSAFENEGKKIKLKDIRRKYPENWKNIYTEAKEKFLEKIKKGFGKRAIICMGEDAFNYVIKFIDGKDFKKDLIEPRIKHIQCQNNGIMLNIYKIDHPSPLNAKNRFLLLTELGVLEKILR